MAPPKSDTQSRSSSEKIEGFPIRVRNRIPRVGNESLRAAAKRLIGEKDWLAPHLGRWLTNKR